MSKAGSRIHHLLQAPGTQQRTLAWREERARLITASDVAALVPQSARTLEHFAAIHPHHGLQPDLQQWASPWSSPDRFLRDKAQAVAHQSRAPTLAGAARPLVWGTCLEPVALGHFERTQGQRVLALGLQRHPEFPWLGASVDGLLEGGGAEEAILEIKCPFSRRATSSPCIPLHQWVQVQIQMEVLDLDRAALFTCYFEPQFPADFVRGSARARVSPQEVQDRVVAGSRKDEGKEELRGAFVAAMEQEELQCYHSAPTLTRAQVVDWALHQRAAIRAGGVPDVYLVLYRLASSSLVWVKRDRAWFREEALPALQAAWSRLSRQLAEGH